MKLRVWTPEQKKVLELLYKQGFWPAWLFSGKVVFGNLGRNILFVFEWVWTGIVYVLGWMAGYR